MRTMMPSTTFLLLLLQPPSTSALYSPPSRGTFSPPMSTSSRHLVEGDMAVPEEQGGQVGVQQSFVLAEDSLWAEGLVPFRFEKMELVGGDLEDLFRDEDMQMIRSVLHGITEAVPCVRFR